MLVPAVVFGVRLTAVPYHDICTPDKHAVEYSSAARQFLPERDRTKNRGKLYHVWSLSCGAQQHRSMVSPSHDVVCWGTAGQIAKGLPYHATCELLSTEHCQTVLWQATAQGLGASSWKLKQGH
jgi:hypothetical protein